ncbi:transposase, partial [Paraburkholderia lycopersici]
KSNGVHDDTPMNGNASSHDTPAGAVHTINWKPKFDAMTVSDAQRLKELEQENSKLKRLLAESMLDNSVRKDLMPRG